ncbi:MAG: hypothetical protein R2831_07540 [Chitinophagaceae bacterium]
MPTAASDWVFAYSNCCRTNALANIVLASTMDLYVETKLDNLASGFNNTVQYINSSLLVFETNKNYVINSGIIDPDGDSLHIEMITPLSYNANPITFLSGFSNTNPFGILESVYY